MAERSRGQIMRIVVFAAIELTGAIMTGVALANSTNASSVPDAQGATTTIAPGAVLTTAPATTALTPASTPAPTSTSPATSVALRTTANELESLLGACPGLPTGTVTAALALRSLGTGHSADPRSQKPVSWVGVGYATKLTDGFRTLPPFAVGVVMDDPASAVITSATAIDRLGQRQVWAMWDGIALHKVLRTSNGTTWMTVSDGAAEPLTIQMATTGVFFFDPGVTSAMRIAAVVVTRDACSAIGLSAGRATKAVNDLV